MRELAVTVLRLIATTFDVMADTIDDDPRLARQDISRDISGRTITIHGDPEVLGEATIAAELHEPRADA